MASWKNRSPVFCAKLNSQGSASVHITLPESLPYSSSHANHRGDYWARPTAQVNRTTADSLLKIMALIKSKMTETHSLSQRRPAVPSGQVQVLCGLQVAPCWQGGTQGIVTATGRRKKDGRKQEAKRRDSCTSTRSTLTCFTHLAHKPVSTTTPVEAHTHAAVPARFLTLNQLWGKQT